MNTSIYTLQICTNMGDRHRHIAWVYGVGLIHDINSYAWVPQAKPNTGQIRLKPHGSKLA